MNVLIVNAGSSSLKYQLFNTETKTVLAKGGCERIGEKGGNISHKVPEKTPYEKNQELQNHEDAIKLVIETLTDKEVGCIASMDEIGAVGHRVVHGGPYFTGSVLATEDVLAKVELCKELAPLHIGPSLVGIHACMDVMKNVPQVLVFDTAFHSTMPEEAYTFAIPREYSEKYHIRRYGFHGSSHRYVSREMIQILGKPAEETKIVTCHLGNGSSIAAVKGGKVIDTTMGFTPLDGLMMGTRSGAIDPAIVSFLMEKENLSADQINNILNKKSGILGVYGASSDFRDCRMAMEEKKDPRATLAIRMLAYQVKKYIGAYTAAMGGLDAVVFTAGIGENNNIIRAMPCEGLEFLGIEIDHAVNDGIKRPIQTTKISTENSKVQVYLIPTNEELIIAEDTESVVSALK
ncbi:MAG: acetate kinase [Clostridia bacterium]|nr:acetate kinase [Clostridia bacterium]